MINSGKKLLKEIFEEFGDARRDALNAIINDEVEEALTYAKKNEIKRATAALYEAKVKEDVIIKLLLNYWKIDKYQALEALRIEKTVKSPKKMLIKYLQRQGYNASDIKEFIKNNDIEKQLENNPILWKLSNSPERLIKVLEQNR